tara:strand:- start:8612 stop:9145 length:534 start_codon:yes stop_codon:yes gene_type:complete
MAGQRLTDKTALTQQAGSGDLLMVVDVSDTTGSAEGTSKQMDFKYVIQTDKISVSNAEIQALDSTPKTLVGALSGYMITPISATFLVTYAASTDNANKNIYLGYDDSTTTNYWDFSERFMSGQTTDNAYVFGGNVPSRYPIRTSSILNTPFIIWSNGAFNGGFTMDVYITYSYTKVL